MLPACVGRTGRRNPIRDKQLVRDLGGVSGPVSNFHLDHERTRSAERVVQIDLADAACLAQAGRGGGTAVVNAGGCRVTLAGGPSGSSRARSRRRQPFLLRFSRRFRAHHRKLLHQ